jgi:hypothetical protein
MTEKNHDSFHVALTGHRPSKLAGYNLQSSFYASLQRRLESIIRDGLKVHQHLTLHSGMALGADTVWSMAILRMRDLNPGLIRFVAEVPVMSQPDRWPSSIDRQRWQAHLAEADEVNVYAKTYSAKCLWDRNHGMIEAADLLLAVWDGHPGGGTAGAAQYAQSLGKTLFTMHPDEFR